MLTPLCPCAISTLLADVRVHVCPRVVTRMGRASAFTRARSLACICAGSLFALTWGFATRCASCATSPHIPGLSVLVSVSVYANASVPVSSFTFFVFCLSVCGSVSVLCLSVWARKLQSCIGKRVLLTITISSPDSSSRLCSITCNPMLPPLLSSSTLSFASSTSAVGHHPRARENKQTDIWGFLGEATARSLSFSFGSVLFPVYLEAQVNEKRRRGREGVEA